MNDNHPIYLKNTHANILRHYARHRFLLPEPNESGLRQLTHELDRAIVVADTRFPPDTIALGSLVEIEFIDPSAIAQYRLVLPHEVKGHPENISVLTPLGLALLGSCVGQLVQWPLPNDRGTLNFRILKLLDKP